MFNNTDNRRGEAGFTLIELAVVMIIIGLLIGGILKGQELIANAQVKATVAQIKAIDTAIMTFRDKYGALPGDLRNASTRLPNCSAAPCNTDGNADGRINEAGLGIWPAIDAEEAVAFSQLSAAGLLAGVQTASTAVGYGQTLPEAKIGGGFMIGYSTGSANASGMGATMPAGHYIVLNGAAANVGAETGPLRAIQAAQIDRTIDDGIPNSGTVRVVSGTNGCSTGNAYNESNESAACALYIRILN